MSSTHWPAAPLVRCQHEPLYRQLADTLLAHIRHLDLPPDCPLPSESQLMGSYGVSRMTVRQAIARLAAEGWVRTEQGKGSFTARPFAQTQRPFWRIVDKSAWFEPPMMETAFLDASVCPATSLLRQLFGLDEMESLYRVRWLKRLNGAVAGLETRYFAQHVAARFGLRLHEPDPVAVLASHAKTRPYRVQVTFRLSLPTDFEAARLGLESDVPVFTVHSTHRMHSDKTIMTGQVMYRIDLFSPQYEGVYEI